MLSIIGCGNPNRSDDGVGSYVIAGLKQALATAPADRVKLFDAGTGGMEVMFQARGSSALVIIDAATSGSEPGTLYEVPGVELEAPHPDGGNLHDFRWQHALYAGRKMYGDEFPKQVSVYLVEAADLSLGLELTSSVQATAIKLIQRLTEQVIAYQEQAA
jgi:hydrogenase maturation protease